MQKNIIFFIRSISFAQVSSNYYIRYMPLFQGIFKRKKPRQKDEVFGAGSRGRTDTVSLPLDFESSTSANSI
ncbi:MAG: hypothetical protein IIU58_03115, partial [Clostridia bacterium]|nr:hypothetical protein [Clostridia bacterium]